MGNKFAAGYKAFGFCDICGFRCDLKDMRVQVVKTKSTNIMACPACWSEDHPQLQLGMYPVEDPQALRNPRPDSSYWQSGLNGLQLTSSDNGTPSEGSRVIQWGWNPVGLNNTLGLFTDTDTLLMHGDVGTVTVTTS